VVHKRSPADSALRWSLGDCLQKKVRQPLDPMRIGAASGVLALIWPPAQPCAVSYRRSQGDRF
jgi:hypothetical protein